jgi:hypothetical protein
MNMRAILLAAMLSGAGLSGGCFTAAKEGYGVVTGPKGVYSQIQPLAATARSTVLAPYSRFELGEFNDGFAGKTPLTLFAHLPGQFRHQLAERRLPNNSTGKTLLVRGTVIYYEGVGGKADVVLGEIEEVIARVELVDVSSGAVLGTAICVGRSTDRVNIGVEKKADGLAKAITAWIAANYPAPSKE